MNVPLYFLHLDGKFITRFDILGISLQSFELLCRFKADIQCRSAASPNPSAFDNTIMASKMNADAHVWRFIPPIEITVIE